MPKSLKTDTSPWTAVFRRIVAQLGTTADVRRVLSLDAAGRGPGLRTWDGSPGDKAPFAPSEGRPIVRLTPMPGSVDWNDPAHQTGTLEVKVEIAVQSLCVDDVIDLWDLVVQALSPCIAGFSAALVALGAETGEIVFADPAFDPRPEAEPEGYFLGVGRFRLRVDRLVNS